ncbi:hypothetical protein FXO37_34925 [Capsicum annuum]|nr:hypothetical protein FXO37_34925 [Capsicum annuum]
MTKNWVPTRRVDGCDAILDTSRHDRIEPQLFWLWKPAQMVTNAIGDAARQDLVGPLKLVIQWLPVSSSIWNCCQVAQPMTILSGAECVDPKDGFRDSSCSSMNHPKGSLIDDIKDATLSLETSPTASPQPLLPLLAPSPLAPFTNSTSPKLSELPNRYLLLVGGSRYPVELVGRQSFVTNLQALDCAASLRLKLQKGNVSKNVYDLCCISLKDFSVQAVRIPALPVVASGQISENIYLLI